MIKEVFGGKLPSEFKVNKTVRAFILSDTLVWSAWNLVAPIFAIYAATYIPGGSIETAASSISIYLVVRVVLELFSGQFLAKVSIRKKILAIILGTFIITLSLIGFALSQNPMQIYLFYGLAGVGFGLSTPVKSFLFSTHLDKNKETAQWGIYDAVIFIGMALAAALGGFIAKDYGFKIVFYIAAVINLAGVLPYLFFLQKRS